MNIIFLDSRLERREERENKERKKKVSFVCLWHCLQWLLFEFPLAVMYTSGIQEVKNWHFCHHQFPTGCILRNIWIWTRLVEGNDEKERRVEKRRIEKKKKEEGKRKYFVVCIKRNFCSPPPSIIYHFQGLVERKKRWMEIRLRWGEGRGGGGGGCVVVVFFFSKFYERKLK